MVTSFAHLHEFRTSGFDENISQAVLAEVGYWEYLSATQAPQIINLDSFCMLYMQTKIDTQCLEVFDTNMRYARKPCSLMVITFSLHASLAQDQLWLAESL